MFRQWFPHRTLTLAIPMTIVLRHLHRRARASLLAAGFAIGGAAIMGGHASAEPPNAFPFPIVDETDKNAIDQSTNQPSGRPAEITAVSDSYVLLRNDNLLVGQVLRLGNTVEIKRGDGSAIRVASAQVSLVAPSAADLYEYRKSNRFAGDVAAIHADARWYLRNDMLRQAARDALLAREVDPRGSETNRLLRQIAGRLRADMERPAPAASTIQTVSHETPIENQPTNDVTEPTSESLALPEEAIYWYQARVQPIFFNRCSGCHTKQENNERTFQIHPSSRARWAPSSTARENLVEILKFVDRDHLAASEIRVRAMDGHGGAKRTFGQENSPMMLQLDRWLASLPQTEQTNSPTTFSDAQPLSSETASHRVATAQIPFAQSAPKATPWSEPGDFQSDQIANSSDESPTWFPGEQTRDQPESSTEHVRRMPEVKNPFDPDIFNRRFHSQPPQ